MIKKIIILGNKGFIGKNLERYFHDNHADIEVIGKDLPEIDLTKRDDVTAMSEVFDQETAVILLAAIKRQFGDTQEAFDQNLKITSNLCPLLKENPVGKFVFFSSSAVYGEDIHNTNITEETPVCPTSYYGMAKYISERLFCKALGKNADSLLVFRPATIYGPGDKGGTYGPVKFTEAVISNEDITLWGDGSELREFLFIDDVVDILGRLIFTSLSGVINIVSGVSYSFCDVLNNLKSITGRQLTVNSRLRSKTQADNVFLNSKLLDEIGPYKFTDLAKGMQDLYDDLITRRQRGEENAGILQA